MVEITSIQFTDEYTGTGATKNSFLLGSFADVITAYVNISIHWETTQNIPITCTSGTKTIKRTDNYSFIRDGFKKGDTFHLTGGSSATNDGNYTISAITDSTITVTGAINTATITATLNGTTAINAMDFYYNLIENSSPLSFISLVDSQTIQKQSASKTAWVNGETVNLSQATKSIGWNTQNSGTVLKNTIADFASNYIQTFTITHSFYITPLYLAGQTVKVNGKYTYPTYFVDINSLKYVCRIDGRFSASNPSIPHTTPTDYDFPYGNVGWFDEFLSGGVADYTVTSVTYTDKATSEIVTQIDLTKDIEVVAILNSTLGSFLGGGTGVGSMIALNFIFCTQNQDDYIDTTTRMLDNFRVDRKLLTIGAASVNGTRYGTDFQAIKSITAVYNSATQCTLTFTVSLSDATKKILKAKDSTDRKYMLMATPQKKTSTYLGDTDRNAALIDFNDFIWNKDDSSLLTFQNTTFCQYPNTTTNLYTDYKGFVGDHVLTKSKFIVDNTSTPLDLTAQVMVVNSVTGESFELEKYTQTFPSNEKSGNVCADVVPQVLNYKLSPNDPRNQVYFNRNVAFDTVNAFGYEFDYPFVLRYETWRNVTNFATAFSCTHTQDWSIYELEPNWILQYWITVNVSKLDYTTQFIRKASLSAKDDAFSDNGSGGVFSLQIDTYYNDGSNLVNGKGLIFGDQDTHVKLTITGDFTALPSGAVGYYAYLALDVSGTGGEFFRDVATSEEEPLTDSAWKQSVLITSNGTTSVDIECDIDYTKLDLNNSEYLITGRLGYKY